MMRTAVVMLPDEATRRGVEDELAYALRARGLQGIPAHRLVPPEEMKDKERVRARLEQAGVVGAVADKLLWAALSETKNPKRVDAFMKDLVSAAAKEVKKQGLVRKR